jgi:hypothetical protein
MVITRGPQDGQKLSKTITDAGKIANLLARAEAVPASTSQRMVCTPPSLSLPLVSALTLWVPFAATNQIKWRHDVAVMTVQLPKPVGVFTDGVVEVWGESTLRIPAQTSFSFYGSNDEAEQLARAVGELWNSAS